MLREAIQNINEAAQGLGNYALRVNERLSYLYKADDDLKLALDDYVTEGFDDKILFVFGIKEDMYMDAVWAQKGFGPIAYKVAMNMQGTMAPNWMESQLSRSAQKVWKEFFDGKGSKDVNKELVGVDPKNYRHYWYSLKRPLSLNKNIKNDERFIGKDPYGEKRGMLDELAEGILRSSMRSIYT